MEQVVEKVVEQLVILVLQVLQHHIGLGHVMQQLLIALLCVAGRLLLCLLLLTDADGSSVGVARCLLLLILLPSASLLLVALRIRRLWSMGGRQGFRPTSPIRTGKRERMRCCLTLLGMVGIRRRVVGVEVRVVRRGLESALSSPL
jgi:hypothetical protein